MVCYEELLFHERYFRRLYEFETWFLTAGEERRLRKLESRVLKIYELIQRFAKYRAPYVVLITSYDNLERKIRWVQHISYI